MCLKMAKSLKETNSGISKQFGFAESSWNDSKEADFRS
jgi:hypothetical protein